MENHAHALAQQAGVHLPVDVLPIEQNPAFNPAALHQIVHAVERFEQRGFAAAGGPDKGGNPAALKPLSLIHISSYGGGKGETFTLPELLELLCAHIPGQNQLRIRLGSLEPRIVTEPFASFLAAHPAICPQFHLSLQSGCDEVLARMNRKYDTARYTRSVQLLRQYLPKVMLTTDIVVGLSLIHI